MTATEVTLTAAEWNQAMAFVLAAEDDEPKESAKGQKPATRRRPAYVAPTRDALNYDGDKWSEMQPPAAKVQTFTEIPPSGPADSGVTKDPATPTTTPDKWATRIGVPQPSGKPSGSMASTSSTDGWSSKTGTPQATQKTMWNGAPTGTSLGLGPDASPTKMDTLNRAPRSSLASVEDLHTTSGGNAALPDGSFFIQTADDLQNCIDKVKSADEQNPRKATHPWYADVKTHIAKRASALGVPNMVPDDWQLSMGSEVARNFTTGQRKILALKKMALPDGSYPIENAGDLKNAIQAFGRAAPAEKAKVKAHIKTRAAALGATKQLPPGW